MFTHTDVSRYPGYFIPQKLLVRLERLDLSYNSIEDIENLLVQCTRTYIAYNACIHISSDTCSC